MIEEECPYCGSCEYDVTKEVSHDLSLMRNCVCFNCDKEFTLYYDLKLTNVEQKQYDMKDCLEANDYYFIVKNNNIFNLCDINTGEVIYKSTDLSCVEKEMENLSE